MMVSNDQARIAAKKRKQLEQEQGLAHTSLYEKEFAAGENAQLIEQVQAKIDELPEVREGLVSELRAKIESGEYNPTGAEIADAMIRRTLADRVR